MENWLIWLMGAVALFIVEMLTPGAFFFACFALGALLTSLLSYLGSPKWLLWTNFFGSSILFVLIAKPIAQRLMKGEERLSNVDELIGKEGLVTEAIAPHKSGEVKVKGEVWKAESSEQISANSLVEVLKVDGTHLIVKKK